MESIHLRRGYSLIEMTIVLGIISALSTFILIKQSNFNDTIFLSNTAYDLALAIRNVEEQGVSGRLNVDQAGTGISNAGQGILFEAPIPAPSGNGLVTFATYLDTYTHPGHGPKVFCHQTPPAGADAPDAKQGDCIYESQDGSLLSNYTLGNGITISNVCAYTDTAGFGTYDWICMSPYNSYPGTLDHLDIVFARPNPNPYMNANGGVGKGSPVQKSCVLLSSPAGNSRYILLSSSGEILVSATPCL